MKEYCNYRTVTATKIAAIFSFVHFMYSIHVSTYKLYKSIGKQMLFVVRLGILLMFTSKKSYQKTMYSQYFEICKFFFMFQ